MTAWRAPAKINWFLEITGKRRDGYHTLSTIFQTISLADTLTIRPSDTLSLTCSDPALPVDENNLVMRAAVELRRTLRETRGARIHVAKRIPMGAGLGGGSSDAATTLLGLQALWKRELPTKSLRGLAARLGADVPFFLQKGLCAAAGIGERLRPLRPMTKRWLLLVYPGFGVSTKEAYSRVRLPWARSKSPREILAGLRRRPSKNLGAHLFNRFEELVFPSHAELPRLKEIFRDAGAVGSLMSGSGSGIFALARSAAHARQLRRAIAARYPQHWIVHTE